ncbi:MAG: hypothetical protein KIS92_17055, partial [Planctomycetota bacterium]|nr:hypothetical protein [Planctomycetota bacterium]
AAVAILALAGATVRLLRQPEIRQATNRPAVQAGGGQEKAFSELAWIAQVPPAEPAPAGGSIRFEEPGQGRAGGVGQGGGVSDGGSTKGGTEGGTEGGGGSIGAAGGPQGGHAPAPGGPPEPAPSFGGTPELPANPALEGFAKQFAFAFRIPETLPGGYEFLEGKPVNPRAVQLIYRRGQGRQIVFLSPASGEDAPVREARIGGRVLRCIRQHGLCAGFGGPMTDGEITQNLKAFTRKETVK